MRFLLGAVLIVGTGCYPPAYEVPQPSEEAKAEAEAAHSEAIEKAQHLCIQVPEPLVRDVLSGLKGWVSGKWHGQPDLLLVIDNISLYALAAGPDEHYVMVDWSVPFYSAEHSGVALLVTGPLDTPAQIQWRLLGLGLGAEKHAYPNPTAFDPIVRTEDIVAPDFIAGCATTGRVKGPFRTWELGGCADSNAPWCVDPEHNSTWDPAGPLPADVER